MKRSILYLVAFPPYPEDRGGKVRVANIIRELSKMASVSVSILYVESEAEIMSEGVENNLSKYLANISSVPFKTSTKISRALKGFLSPLPYDAYSYASKNIKIAVENEILRIRPSIVLVSRLSMLQHIESCGITTIYDQHDFSRNFWLSATRNRSLAKSIWARLNYVKCIGLEKRLYRSVDAFISVTDKEYSDTHNAFPDNRGLLVPNGVDTGRYNSSMIDACAPSNSLVILGSMDQERNIDACEYFCESIWGKVKQNHPHLKLYIVGRSPSDRVIRLGEKFSDVFVTGTVQDERPYLKNNIMLAPFRIGAGVKHKVLMGMAMGMPVVGTVNAFQGISIKNYRDGIIVKDSIDSFVQALENVLGNVELRDELSLNARKFVVAKYSWSALLRPLMSLIDDIR